MREVIWGRQADCRQMWGASNRTPFLVSSLPRAEMPPLSTLRPESFCRPSYFTRPLKGNREWSDCSQAGSSAGLWSQCARLSWPPGQLCLNAYTYACLHAGVSVRIGVLVRYACLCVRRLWALVRRREKVGVWQFDPTHQSRAVSESQGIAKTRLREHSGRMQESGRGDKMETVHTEQAFPADGNVFFPLGTVSVCVKFPFAIDCEFGSCQRLNGLLSSNVLMFQCVVLFTELHCVSRNRIFPSFVLNTHNPLLSLAYALKCNLLCNKKQILSYDTSASFELGTTRCRRWWQPDGPWAKKQKQKEKALARNLRASLSSLLYVAPPIPLALSCEICTRLHFCVMSNNLSSRAAHVSLLPLRDRQGNGAFLPFSESGCGVTTANVTAGNLSDLNRQGGSVLLIKSLSNALSVYGLFQ